MKAGTKLLGAVGVATATAATTAGGAGGSGGTGCAAGNHYAGSYGLSGQVFATLSVLNSGMGASSIVGAGGQPVTVDNSGHAATGFCAGGGGSGTTASTAATGGGAGSGGWVRITEYIYL